MSSCARAWIALLATLATAAAFAAHAADTRYAFMTGGTSHTVGVVDLGTDTVVAIVSVPGTPGAVAASPTGGKAYVGVVGNINSVVVQFDTTTRAITWTSPSIPNFGCVDGLALTPDGTRLYATDSCRDMVYVLDTSNGNILASIAGVTFAKGIALTPAGAKAYVTNPTTASVTVIDTATNTVTATIGGLPIQPIAAAVDPSGTRAYVTHGIGQAVSVIDVATDTVVTTLVQANLGVPLGRPSAIAVNPAGTEIYFTDQNNLRIVDASTFAYLGTIVSAGGLGGVSFDATGGTAVVAGTGTSSAMVVDTATRTVTADIPLVLFPLVASNPSSFGTFIATGPAPVTAIAPSITSASSATFTVNSAGTFTATATGTPAPTLSLTGTLPSGVTFTASTGVLAGTPAPGTAGSYPLTVAASNGTLPDASQAFTLTVAKANQTLAFTNPGARLLGSGAVALSASATSGLAVVFTSGTPSVCSASGSSATLLAAGTCTVHADQPGNADYNAATRISQSFAISTPAAITSANAATFIVGAASSFVVTASGTPQPSLALTGALPQGVTFTPASGLLEGTPAAGTVGTYPLAFVASNGTGSDASQPFTLTVAKASQTIAFANPGAQPLAATPIALAATASSGLAVTFTTSTPAVCSVSGSSATALAGGTCTIVASQAGNANVSAAPQVSQGFAINGSAPVITTAATATFTVNEAGVFIVAATGNPTPALSITGTLPAGLTFTPSTGAIAGTPAPGTAGAYALTIAASNGPLSNASQSLTLQVARQSQSIVLANPGSQPIERHTLPLAASASSGLPVALASATLGVCTVAEGIVTLVQGGICTIVAQQAGGADYAAAFATQSFEILLPTTPHVTNMSARIHVASGNDVMIVGFVIGGTTPKTVAVVAMGPSLVASGISNPLPNPTLTIVRSSDGAIVGVNDDWQVAPNAAQLQAAGFAPHHPLESAVLATLAPGAYTAIVRDASGATGVGLAAVYEVDHYESPLVNTSTRGLVLGGDDAMIGGFIVQGSGPKRVVIMAVGPSLVAAGIDDALADPKLTLVRSLDGAVLAENDDWTTAPNAAQIQALGLAPADTREAAILVTLEPGAYTAVVTGVDGATGVGIVAAYVLP